MPVFSSRGEESGESSYATRVILRDFSLEDTGDREKYRRCCAKLGPEGKYFPGKICARRACAPPTNG